MFMQLKSQFAYVKNKSNFCIDTVAQKMNNFIFLIAKTFTVHENEKKIFLSITAHLVQTGSLKNCCRNATHCFR